MIYSFRAECWIDVKQFLAAAWNEGSLTVRPDPTFSDLDVEFESTGDLDTLKALTHLIEDAHVIRETLRACPLAENSLERDYGR